MNLRAASSLLLSVWVLSSFAVAGDSIVELPKKAVERSRITAPGSSPFILKAKVVEITNLANTNYRAEIEEYWVAPDKWRRSVKTPNFSETLVVNGDVTSEQTTGDYYPNWLRTLVTGIFDPGAALQGVDLTRSSDSPRIGVPEYCRRFTYMAGVAPVSNKVFSSYCFLDGLIESIQTPGYSVSYKDYKKFAGKQVARKIQEYIENGTVLEATVNEISELKSPDEAMFAVEQPNAQLRTIRTDEATLRGLAVTSPDIIWPTVRSGATKGTLSLYVCLDRNGQIRETYELNSSNPGLNDVVRDQIKKWKFKTAANEGVPVQVESILTFAFDTSTADPIPVLNEEEAKQLIVHRVEPAWPEGFAAPSTPIFVTIGVDENGDSKGLVFITSDEEHRRSIIAQIPRIERSLNDTLKKWRFQPYVREGKPTEYQVKVTFYAK